MKTYTEITVGSEGRNNFHNSPDLTLHIKPDQYDPIKGDTIYLTDSQERRIYRHFCGISDCCCGSAPDGMDYIGADEAILKV